MVQGLISKHSLFIFLILLLGVITIFGPTMLDYIVNNVMYDYGLKFDYGWFIIWAAGLHITAFGTSVSNISVYWLARPKELRRKFTAFMIGLTGYWQLISGNEDLIWFVVFDGGLPPMNKIWWWMPQHWVLQYINPNWNWTTLHELIWIAVFNIILIAMWTIAYYKRYKKI